MLNAILQKSEHESPSDGTIDYHIFLSMFQFTIQYAKTMKTTFFIIPLYIECGI